ncbi:MAG: RNA polymerase sigma factor [Firmicutes bacterium]|nr:RNA polymerase sigma factor [Bacillota bacterium]
MEDSKIIELYNMRSEDAIARTSEKYGGYLNTIAYNILGDSSDAEECVSDTYLKVWNAIPPAVPKVFRTFIGKITRNLALDSFEKRNAAKRGGGNTALCLDELAECIADAGDVEKHVEMSELVRALNAWLEGLETEKRVIFVRRYWHMDGIADIAAALGLGESNVKVTLHRLRGELKEYLTKEGFEI